jgi:tRNA A37 threonylcarbamoyladenosine dehydratase
MANIRCIIVYLENYALYCLATSADSMAFVPSVAGLIIAAEVVKDLINTPQTAEK